MLHWPSTPSSGVANTERLASFAKDDHIAHILSIWSKSIRLIVCLHNDTSYFILTCYSWESFDVSNHPSFPIWCYNASPHTMKSCPVPLTEIFFSVSQAWHEWKDTVNGTWQSRTGSQSSSNRVGEIAGRNLTDAVFAGCLLLRREDCLCGLWLHSQPMTVLTWRADILLILRVFLNL